MALLSYQDAARSIASGRIPPFCLFYGEEVYLREELQRFLARSFLGEDARYGLEKVEGAAVTLEQVLANLEGGNLFSKKRLVIIVEPPFLAPAGKKDEKKSKKKAEQETAPTGRAKSEDNSVDLLQGFLAKEGSFETPEKVIIFIASAVDRRKKIFKLLKDKGLVVDCSPLKGGELAAWIRRKVERAGKTIEKSALERLLLAGDSNLWHLSQEIDKYITYLDEDDDLITEEVIELLYAGDAQGNVFKLADALSEGNLSRALQLLRQLLDRREKPVPIFFMLVRHYRLLLTAFALLEDNVPVAQYAGILQVPPFAVSKLREQASAYSLDALQAVMLILQKIDLQIKTGRLEPNHALEIALGQIHHIYTTTR